MDEQVYYVKRSNGVFGAIATTPFILAGLGMVIAGFIIAAGDGKDANGGYVFAIIGGLAVLPFAYVFVQSVRTIRSPGRLRLTDNGFDVYKHSFAWTDVEDFHSARTGGDSPTDYVKVVWAPSVLQHPAIRRSARLETFGQNVAPTYIQDGQFDTGGASLQEILRRWKAGDRTAGRPVEAHQHVQVPHTEPELTIPRKHGDTIGALVFAVPLFVGFAVGGPVLALLEGEHHSTWEWIGAVAVWLLLTAFLGAGVFGLAKGLRKRGLRLHTNGFEYEDHAWAWADIDDIRPAGGGEASGLRAVFRSDRPLPSAPSNLPFLPDGFATNGRPVDAILRDWLQRYRTQREN